MQVGIGIVVRNVERTRRTRAGRLPGTFRAVAAVLAATLIRLAPRVHVTSPSARTSWSTRASREAPPIGATAMLKIGAVPCLGVRDSSPKPSACGVWLGADLIRTLPQIWRVRWVIVGTARARLGEHRVRRQVRAVGTGKSVPPPTRVDVVAPDSKYRCKINDLFNDAVKSTAKKRRNLIALSPTRVAR